MVKVDLHGAKEFFRGTGPDYAQVSAAHRLLEEGKGPGSDFTGWLSLPTKMLETEHKALLSAAAKIRSQSKVLVVVGIGGSYLGARAAIELMRGPNHNNLPGDGVRVYFLGNGLSPDAVSQTLALIGDADFSVNVISKSGTTLEPALAFRILRNLLEERYGAAGAKKRIYATTDPQGGALRALASAQGWETFVVPGDVGGRYSVLSAVGLLPMAAAGIDITKVLHAAVSEMHDLDRRSPENPAWQYAAARQHLYAGGKTVEILAYYNEAFRYFAEWWKQLYGESEGKGGLGIYPASVEYTADLHSMGQYIQDGPRNLMETVVRFERFKTQMSVPFAMGDPDGLNYLAGRDMGAVCHTVADAVKVAHISGGVPNIGLSVPACDEEGFAALVCFFELSCALSGYMMGVNPFDQPGVEAYKKTMFQLLGKGNL